MGFSVWEGNRAAGGSLCPSHGYLVRRNPFWESGLLGLRLLGKCFLASRLLDSYHSASLTLGLLPPSGRRSSGRRSSGWWLAGSWSLGRGSLGRWALDSQFLDRQFWVCPVSWKGCSCPLSLFLCMPSGRSSPRRLPLSLSPPGLLPLGLSPLGLTARPHCLLDSCLLRVAGLQVAGRRVGGCLGRGRRVVAVRVVVAGSQVSGFRASGLFSAGCAEVR